MKDSKSHRTITGAFGVMLVLLAVVTLVVVEPDLRWRAGAVAVVIGFLGVDAILASMRGTTSLVSRIGPLP